VAHSFPFSAIVGQDEMKQAILMAAVDASLGGVLVLGDRGTGKSTAVRALAALLPPMQAVVGCPYHCDPQSPRGQCSDCDALKVGPGPAAVPAPALAVGKAGAKSPSKIDSKSEAKRKPKVRSQSVTFIPASHLLPVPVVDLPLGATEDRVVGALDLERALSQGIKAFEPGLLARANRGFLYIDEVNLLEDHLVDLLIDVAASGENVVEREGLSVRHPARFVLVGSGNPEEGELRPQLLDRFGLSVEVKTPTDIAGRVEVVKRRDAFERDPAAFSRAWKPEDDKLAQRIAAARALLPDLVVPDAVLERGAQLCMNLGTDGLRGELTLLRAARALAALDGDRTVAEHHLRRVAPSALRHRLRRNPLDDAGSSVRVDRALAELFGG
jgi:magnesium chelatase subunit I